MGTKEDVEIWLNGKWVDKKGKPFFCNEQIVNTVYFMFVESLFIADFFFFRNSGEPTGSAQLRRTVAG